MKGDNQKFVELLNELMDEESTLHVQFQKTIEKAREQMKKEHNYPHEEVVIIFVFI